MLSNELRVFVSSTFADLVAEREHLVMKVFPELRSFCRARGVTFTEVELRWGLTEEHVVLGQMIRACLQEIDRCRPYFIGILGDRYGYVPEIAEIYKDPELLRQYPWIEDAAMEGSSMVELEVRHGALNNPEAARSCACFYLRASGEQPGELSEDSRRCDELGSRIRAAGLRCTDFAGVDELGAAIMKDLAEIVEREFAGAVPPTSLEEERARHRAFAASRRLAYIPNRDYLSTLAAWLDAPDAPPLLLHGESGSGKSALVSFWCERLRRRRGDLHIVEHYVGAGYGSDDHVAIMRHVLEEIKEAFNRSDEIPSTAEGITAEFSNWLGFTLGAPLLLIIDGIDHLDEAGRSITWLPPTLPPGFHLLLTSASDEGRREALARDWRALDLLPLRESEREAVAVRVLAEYGKALSPEQVRRIAADDKCALPLFLRALLDELRISALHETLDREVDRYLAVADTEELFECVLERVEAGFGREATCDVMSLLHMSRLGLDESDLHALTGLSPLKIASIVSGLDYHLVRRGGLLSYFHAYLTRAVKQRYLSDGTVARQYAARLADYFERDVSIRGSRELIEQCQKLGDPARVRRALVFMPRLHELWNSPSRYELLSVWAAEPPEKLVEALESEWNDWGEGGSPEHRWAVASDIADVLRMANAFDAAQRWYGRLVEIGRELGDKVKVGKALAERALLLANVARLDEATSTCEEAIGIWRETFNDELLAQALNIRGQVYLFHDEHEMASRCFEEAEHVARVANDMANLSQALNRRIWLAVQQGDFDAGLRFSEELSRIARQRGDRVLETRAFGAAASIETERCNLDGAVKATRAQETIARALGLRAQVAAAINGRARAFYYLGNARQAARLYAYQVALNRETNDRLRLGVALCHFAASAAEIQAYGSAYRAFDEAERILRAIGYRHGLVYELLWRSGAVITQILSARSLPAEKIPDAKLAARRDLEEAHELACEPGLQGVREQVELLLAQLDRMDGRTDAARDRIRNVIDEATDPMSRADAHYQMWHDGLDRGTDHAAAAIAIYREIFAKRPLQAIRERLAELEEAEIHE